MARTRRVKGEVQGTRGSRDVGTKVSISPSPMEPTPDKLAAKLEYIEGRYTLDRLNSVKDDILAYFRGELEKVWRQLRGGYTQAEDFRLPQNLDQFGRVVRTFNPKTRKWVEVSDVDTTLDDLQTQITRNDADISTLQAGVIQNYNDIATLTVDVSALQAWLPFDDVGGGRSSVGVSSLWNIPSRVFPTGADNYHWGFQPIRPDLRNITANIEATWYYAYNNAGGAATLSLRGEIERAFVGGIGGSVVLDSGTTSVSIPTSTGYDILVFTASASSFSIGDRFGLSTAFTRYGSAGADTYGGSIYYLGSELIITEV